MTIAQALMPAPELATHDRRFPNDRDDYRKAGLALLAEEIELRRHIERVAAQRRSLPSTGNGLLMRVAIPGNDGLVRQD